jgi:hypothetical protein
MPGEMLIHGDAEALIVEVLRDATPELTSYAPRVSTDLRGYSSGNRWIMVTVEGGAHVIYNIISKPRIDIEVRAERRDVAHDMAQICLGSLFRAIPYSAYGATLTEVLTELGLVNVPDKEEEESYRFIFSLRGTCTIDPASAPGAES